MFEGRTHHDPSYGLKAVEEDAQGRARRRDLGVVTGSRGRRWIQIRRGREQRGVGRAWPARLRSERLAQVGLTFVGYWQSDPIHHRKSGLPIPDHATLPKGQIKFHQL